MPMPRAILVAAVGGYAAALLVTWASVFPVNDFAGFIAAGRALAAGIDPYDPARWPDAYRSLGTQKPDTDVFGYPPWIAIAMLPFGPLPLVIGSLLWSGGGLALAMLGVAAVARRFDWGRPHPYLALAGLSWPTYLAFLQGQWSFLILALACALLLDLDARRDLRAGGWWAALALIKPQLFVVGSVALAIWAIATRRFRVVLAAAGTVIAAVAIGTAVFPGWLGPWFQYVAAKRVVRSTQQPTLAGLSGDIAGDLWPIVWVAAAVALGVITALTVRRVAPRQRLPVSLAMGLTVSIATALYSWSYDQYATLLCGCAAIALVRSRAIAIASFALFGPLALALFLSSYPRYHDTLAGLIPPLAIALLAYAATRTRATS